ncbi:group I truncated hemoglobin [Marinobacter pelagius]|uniref:Hemoglobin n=1 Tax=Marinobacter pelagius TaxID=379482 RepID=A0A1I4R6P4_9GAMM|nr:group 1 truncated hemoglobin [Marinobacter pelagius]SFM47931.1 hemoglobin [Marinobacter pelagius]
MTESLFNRLGGVDGITRIANDVVDNHAVNKVVGVRFADIDLPKLKHAAATFFVSATGGPSDAYQGKDMLAAHRGMNISPSEFMAVLDDALLALEKNGIGQREREEVLYALYGLRSQVVAV